MHIASLHKYLSTYLLSTRKIEMKYMHYTVVEWVEITQKQLQDFLVPAKLGN